MPTRAAVITLRTVKPLGNAHPVLTAWKAHPGLGRAFAGAVLLAGGLGLALLVGGPRRAQAVGFTTIREVGGIELWGLMLIGAAVALLVGAAIGPRWLMVTLLFGALIHGLLAVWFFTATQTTEASYFGAIYSAVMCWWHTSQALEYGR